MKFEEVSSFNKINKEDIKMTKQRLGRDRRIKPKEIISNKYDGNF